MTCDKKIDVLGLGAVTIDFVGTVDSWPEQGTKTLLKSLAIHDGGLVGTALAAVAQLGGKACFAGKLGNSDMAERALEALQKDGVDTSFVIRDQSSEPVIAFVLTDCFSGQRNVFWTRQNVQYPLPTEFPDPGWFDKTAVLMVDYESGRAGIEAAKIAAAHNIPVVVDAENNEPHVPELLAVSSHIILSEDFAAAFTGKTDPSQILQALQTSPNQTVIITRGEKGCAGLTSDGIFELPAFKVDVIDTTGCGDVFHGAYALAVAREHSIPEAARFASVAAALCATKLGGRDGIPTKDQLDAFFLDRMLR
ncbi:MAG: PfkB family carbohydrate kinase [Planctomycetota bacterium]